MKALMGGLRRVFAILMLWLAVALTRSALALVTEEESRDGAA